MFAALSVPSEKTFAEISAKVEFQQCGEILRHGIFISLPLVFAHIFSVLVLYNAATCCKGVYSLDKNNKKLQPEIGFNEEGDNYDE